jgi:hypothetical protein
LIIASFSFFDNQLISEKLIDFQSITTTCHPPFVACSVAEGDDPEPGFV